MVSRARAINRHELRGNEAGRAAPERYAHDAHDDHGRADATGSNLGNERRPDAPCFQRIIPLFPHCYLLLEKLSKSLIPLGDCPFVLNRLPVFLGKSPCFQAEAGFATKTADQLDLQALHRVHIIVLQMPPASEHAP
jgi:hypothetical protein